MQYLTTSGELNKYILDGQKQFNLLASQGEQDILFPQVYQGTLYIFHVHQQNQKQMIKFSLFSIRKGESSSYLQVHNKKFCLFH